MDQDDDDDRHVRYGEFEDFKHHMEEALMTTQAEIDALTATITQVATDVATVQTDVQTATTDLQTEINNLAAGGVDITALQAAVAPLDSAVQTLDGSVKALGGLQPAQPAPAPDPAPAPAPAPEAVTSTDQLDQPVYTTTLDPATIAAEVWPASGYETAPTDGTAPVLLYDYASDTPGSQTANGAGADNGAWSQYTGPIQAVPAAS